GVGPGNTEAYWQEIYRYDNLIGGCVWEMVDHAVLHADGTYTYGGDHGEYVHDGNFCVDGMFYPDRKPSAGAKIIKFIYRPIRLRHLFGDVFELFNTTAFSEGDRYRMTVTWNDGKKVDVPVTAGPLQKVRVTVPLGAEVNGTQIADVVVRDRKTDAVVSEGSLILKQEGIAAPATTSFPAGASVENGRFTLKLPNGKTLTTADEGTLLYRAGTDNDSIFGIYSNMPPYYGQKEKLKSCEKTAAGYKVVSEVKNRIAKYLVEDLYEGTDDGILVTSRIHKTIGVGTLPRFAKSFRLDESFDDVTYTARTGESYADMKEQFPVRTVSCKVADMTEPNLRPQESGNRCDCTSASVSDGSATVTFEAVEKPFELNIKPYTDEALKHMKHREDEVRTGTYVTINAFQMGIGTGACGPGIAPEYKYSSDEAYELKFLIKC
ncbi:MAG: glycoside hydrolase family 2 TIM barrel-domain containing protein, partial [Acutalibacteraceae bacterium]|nr:glycoside hydrolase family 2 TIM barrel-domain containing protein [Acutalibacteraceae bacterium]